MVKNKILNIGIIAPRTYSVDGYDQNNTIRQRILKSICSILRHYKQSHEIIGITGLAQGSEQDFAFACKFLKIKYIACLPYENQENLWVTGLNEYKVCLDEAFDIEILTKGNYSPRKIINKNKFISDRCDIILYVENRLKNKCPILRSLLNDNKTIFILRTN